MQTVFEFEFNLPTLFTPPITITLIAYHLGLDITVLLLQLFTGKYWILIAELTELTMIACLGILW